jgi:hypothetical protein
MGKRFFVWSGTALLISTLAFAGCGKKEEPAPPPPAPAPEAPAAPAGEPGAMAPAPETAPMAPGAPAEEKKEEGAKTK